MNDRAAGEPPKAALEKAGQAVDRSAARAAAHASDIARTKTFNALAVLIVGTFCLCVVATFALAIAGAFYQLPWERSFGSLMEVLKSVLLPIASTIVGYYLATRGK